MPAINMLAEVPKGIKMWYHYYHPIATAVIHLLCHWKKAYKTRCSLDLVDHLFKKKLGLE